MIDDNNNYNHQGIPPEHFADFDAMLDSEQPGSSVWGYALGVVALVASVAGAVYIAYEQGVTDTLQTTIPVVSSSDQVVYVAPENPGGAMVPNQEKEVFNYVRNNRRRASVSDEQTQPLIIQLQARRLSQENDIPVGVTVPSEGFDVTTATLGSATNESTSIIDESAPNLSVIEGSNSSSSRAVESIVTAVDPSDQTQTVGKPVAMAQTQSGQTIADIDAIVASNGVIVEPMDGSGRSSVLVRQGGSYSLNDVFQGDMISAAVESAGGTVGGESHDNESSLDQSRGASEAANSPTTAEETYGHIAGNALSAGIAGENNNSAVLSRASDEQFVAQVATLRSHESAMQEWRDVVRRHPTLVRAEPIVKVSSFSSGAFAYQLRIGPYFTRQEADVMCQALLAGGERECVVRRM